MNLKEDTSRTVLCIIANTGEERDLYPVYDSDDTTNLNIIDAAVGIGKFYGWMDPITKEIFEKRVGAYPKPLEPFEMFGIECGRGWNSLIEPIFNWIKNYNDEHEDNPIEIQQIKEKFGGLRIYVSHEPEELKRMIIKAEGDSYGICEECGSQKEVGHTVGWIKTVCRKCVEKEVRESKWKNQIRWQLDGITCLITKEGIEEI